MIPEIPTQPMPDWISNASAPLPELCIREVLSGSVYYPACEFDGDPVKYLAGNFHSFVYVDYGVGRDSLLQNLDGFRGYRILAHRDVTERQLTPNGWTPQFPRPSDGDPRSRADWIKPPFGVWSIHERREEYGPDHGPSRFSLLYYSGEEDPCAGGYQPDAPARVGRLFPRWRVGLVFVTFFHAGVIHRWGRRGYLSGVVSRQSGSPGSSRSDSAWNRIWWKLDEF